MGNGRERDLQLQEHGGGAADDLLGCIDVGGDEFAVGPWGNDDRVLPFWVNQDHGAAAGDAFGDGDAGGADVVLGEAVEQALAEIVIPDACNQFNARLRTGEPGGGDRLVGTLSAGDGHQLLAHDGFAGGGDGAVRQTRSMFTEPMTTMRFALAMR